MASTRRLAAPLLVQTAHGLVPCDNADRIYIHDRSLLVWAGMLDDSPAVLSLGLLCSQLGYSYSWDAGVDHSYLVENRKSTRCTTVCNAPTVSIATSAESQEAGTDEDAESIDAESSGGSSSETSGPPSLASSSSSSTPGYSSSGFSSWSPAPSSSEPACGQPEMACASSE